MYSLPGTTAGGLLREVRPHIDIQLTGIWYSEFSVVAEDVVLRDNEGRRFRVVGIWPSRGNGYRLDINAIEFNRHVKSYFHSAPSNDAERERDYRLSLHLPFTCRGRRYTMHIPYIRCVFSLAVSLTASELRARASGDKQGR